MKHKWFFNFDGFRFLAALIVVLAHIEAIKDRFHLPSLSKKTPFFTHTPPLAVIFFFVLSGFLITYLLLTEKLTNEPTGKRINIARFYKKRILRIWPLYYVLILSVYFAFPFLSLFSYPGYNSNFLVEQHKGLLLFLFFCPNLSELLHGNILYLGQTWSLGVEEFSYLFFPLGLYVIPLKHTAKYIVLVFFLSITASLILPLLLTDERNTYESAFLFYSSRYLVYTFALGALAAYNYMLFYKSSFVLKHRRSLKIISLLLFFAVVILLLEVITFSFFTNLFYAIMFSLLIFILSVSDTKIYLLNTKPFIYLGKISYSIYMLHPLVIVACLKLFYFDTGNSFFNTFLFDIITVVVTIMLSIVSYTYLEKPFLKMKRG